MSGVQFHKLVRSRDMISCQLNGSPSQREILLPQMKVVGTVIRPSAGRRANGMPRYQFRAPVSAPGSAYRRGVAVDVLIRETAVSQ